VNLARAAAYLDGLEHLARRKDSPVHRLHPLARLAAALVYVAAVVSFPGKNSLSGLGVFFLYPAVLIPLSGTPFKPLLTGFLLSLPFVLCGALWNLFALREVVFLAGPLPVTEGMLSLVSILFRAFLAVTAALLLAATIPFPVIAGLLARLGLPRVLCLQMVLTWRYLAVLIREAQTLYTAYRLRSRRVRGVRMADMGGFLGQLLVRSFDRALRVFTAMKSRGFSLSSIEALSLTPAAPMSSMKPIDWLYLAGVCAFSLFFRFFDAGSFYIFLFSKAG